MLWLFPSSQETNNRKSSSLLLANLSGAQQEQQAGFASQSWVQWPEFLFSLPPCKGQEQLDPNLGDTSSHQRSLDPSTAQPCRQPGASFAPCVWMCFFLGFFCEFPPSRLLCHIWKFV